MRQFQLSRRSFLGGVAAGAALAAGAQRAPAAEPAKVAGLDVDPVDFHVHVEGVITLDKAEEISKARGVKFGVVEHAGGKENQYPRLLSSDEDLKKYLAGLAGRPFYKGVQAEWLDWPASFSKQAVAELDYVLSDAMTYRDAAGRRVKLWQPGFDIGDPDKFMDAFAEFHAEVMAVEPIDILANATWIPAAILPRYDELWTEKRLRKVIDGALKYQVALEINSGYHLPRLAQLRVMKEAGVTFSFGSNIRGPNVGNIDYCLDMARQLGLTRKQMFRPAPAGQKPIQRRA